MTKKYKYFLVEAVELLAELTRGLLDLEKKPEKKSSIKKVLRTLHTLKGAASVMGLSITSGLAHAMESCLICFRDQDKTITAEHITLLLEACTRLEECISQVKQGKDDKAIQSHGIILKLTGREDHASKTDIKTSMEKIVSAFPDKESGSREKKVYPGSKSSGSREKRVDPGSKSSGSNPVPLDETIRIKIDVLDQITKLSNEILINNIWLKNMTGDMTDLVKKWEHLPTKFKDNPGISLEKIEQGLGWLEKKVSDTAALSREISDLIKETHMVPVKPLLFMYEKFVRDLSLEIGKKIKFETKGSDIYLGRSLLDQIKEPIFHLLRNCIIHGIEAPEERLDRGKTESGTICLEFIKEMGQVHIICYDDGRGLDAQAIKNRSVEKGLLTQNAVEAISDVDAYYLILKSGYSSAKIVTEFAGRGVGLDVVKNCISGMGGAISLESKKLGFCRIILTLPLSIDLTSIFAVQVMDQYYLFPFRTVIETRLIKEKQIFFETGKPVISYNETPIPLVRLSEILNISGAEKQTGSLSIILVKGDFEILALVVDKLIGRMEVMPRKLEGRLGQIPNFLSSTILADGYPGFILDVAGIIEISKTLIMSDLKEKTEHRKPDILVIDDSMTTSMLIEGMLSSNGYNVTLAKNGEQALEIFSQQDFDLFVTDIQMPGIDGFELSKKIRQLHRYKDAPIVILSSLGSDAELRKGLEVGANAYIVKGTFDEDEFLSTIGSLIG
ncbi:MAG: response regulator [Desulfobacteraceae bacterium]|nr:response regulator [Desulfobacteraceae bacterium]